MVPLLGISKDFKENLTFILLINKINKPHTNESPWRGNNNVYSMFTNKWVRKALLHQILF